MKSHFILDFRKVVWAHLYEVNQEGTRRRYQADYKKLPTVYGGLIDNPDAYAIPLDRNYPSESRIERARRLDIIDQWRPRVEFRCFSRELVTFEGDQAIETYTAYRANLFAKSHKQKPKQAKWKV